MNQLVMCEPDTPAKAKCCEACKHWHRIGAVSGECQNPMLRWGVTYRNEKTGKEQYVEWWTTGCYYSCRLFELKTMEATA